MLHASMWPMHSCLSGHMITGKLLSPRKIMMDIRARMKEKGAGLMKEGAAFDDGKSLIGDYISEEELWACTMCNACVQECPININQSFAYSRYTSH